MHRRHAARLLLALVALPAARAFLPSQNPPWGVANYNMSQSTLSMRWNSSGWSPVSLDATFGVVSYDWSNAKAQWAAARPMNDWELLLEQAAMTRRANPAARVFLYANLVKALPWMSWVREKLEDPAYAGWFLPFAAKPPFANGSYHVPACDDAYEPPLCSSFYHDQSQTPAVPSPAQPNPDGACVGVCDCGGVVPCGEYLWDLRNASLRSWLVAQLVAPISAGLIDGWFIDDFWCSDSAQLNGSGACTDPVQGPTEVDAHSQADMGLSDGDVAALTTGWLAALTAAQAGIVAAGGYTWSLMPGQDNANAMPLVLAAEPAACAAQLRAACAPDSPWLAQPLLAGVHVGSNASDPLPHLQADVAAFLLQRGPWAWLGWGQWGVVWDPSVPRPREFDVDYGAPLDAVCAETAPGTGVFARRFEHVDASLDCNTLQARLEPR